MPGYANIGGSWRELSGGGYANIGGSWRQISEGYQLRGGVWEKVFPNYKDYGDEVDLFGDGMMTYGYWAWDDTRYPSAHQGNSIGTTDASTSTGYNRCYLCDGEDDYGTYAFHWFPTQQTIDLRGYNYLAAYIMAHFGRGGATLTSTRMHMYPFISVGTSSPTSWPSEDSKYVKSSTAITPTSGNSNVYTYVFVDLSNCKVENAYLKVGAYLTTDYDDVTNAPWGYIQCTSSVQMYLYKNKSDCTISAGSSNSVSLTY